MVEKVISCLLLAGPLTTVNIFWNQHEQTHSFWHLKVSCLEMGRTAIPQINTNSYSVQKDLCYKKFWTIGQLEQKLSTGGYHDDRPTMQYDHKLFAVVWKLLTWHKSLTQIYAPVSYDISGIKVSRGPVAQDG